MPIFYLPDRAAVFIKGQDCQTFLSGLLTNHLPGSKENACYTALLTPQGKYLFDMILVWTHGGYWLDCAKIQKDDLIKRLTLYRLRSAVDITDMSDTHAIIAGPENILDQHLTYADPRHKVLGLRAIAPKTEAEKLTPLGATYKQKLLDHTIPDGPNDMIPEKDFWLETGAERLNGVAFDKGCYVGQELTSRMKHLTDLKKQFFTVSFDGPSPAFGTPVLCDGKKIGTIRSALSNRSAHSGQAIAMLRIKQALSSEEKSVNGRKITVHNPS